MKKVFSVLLILGLVFSFAGCDDNDNPPGQTGTHSEVGESGTVLPSAVVAVVNGIEITKGEVDQVAYLNYESIWGQQSEEARQEMYKEALQVLIKREAARQKAKEYGMFELTAEEQKELDDYCETVYQEQIQAYVSQIKAEEQRKKEEESESTSEITAEYTWDFTEEDYIKKADDEFRKYLNEYMYYCLVKFDKGDIVDRWKEYIKDMRAISIKLFDYLCKDLKATDEQINKKYNEYVEHQKELYKDKSYFSIDYFTENLIVYIPEGIKLVKCILVDFSVENKNKLGELEGAMNEARAKKDESQETKEDYELKKKAYDEALAKEIPSIQTKVDEAYNKVKNGDDFDTLIDEYSPSMIDMRKEKGYMIYEGCTDLSYDVIEKALTLNNEEDYCGPVYSADGGYIVLFFKELQSKNVPLFDVKEEIEEEAYKEAINEFFNDKVNEWVENSETEVREDVLAASVEWV